MTCSSLVMDFIFTMNKHDQGDKHSSSINSKKRVVGFSWLRSRFKCLPELYSDSMRLSVDRQGVHMAGESLWVRRA